MDFIELCVVTDLWVLISSSFNLILFSVPFAFLAL